MIRQENLIETWLALPRKEFDQELRRVLNASRRELVAAVARAACVRGKAFGICRIDEFRVTRARCAEDECLVLLYYRGAVQRRGTGPDKEARIFGSAVLTIDGEGRVSCKGATLNEELALDEPDRENA